MRCPVFDDCALESGTWGYQKVRRLQEVAVSNTRQVSRWRSSYDGGDGKDLWCFEVVESRF